MLGRLGWAALFALVALPAAAAEWEVVPAESRLGFVGTQNGKEFTGQFETFSGEITFDPQALDSARVTVEVDTGSIETSFPDDQDQAARGSDWFSVKKHPTAVFRATDFRRTGDGAYVAEGTLTIRDMTQQISLPFTLDISGDTAEMRGSVTVNRGAFGVGRGQFAEGKWFGLDVRVVIDLTARRKA